MNRRWFLLPIPFILFIYFVLPWFNKVEWQEIGPSPDSALEVSKRYVANSLKSPSTANFGNQGIEIVSNDSDGVFSVRGWVESQNGFGVTVRTYFICEVQYLGDDHWKCNHVYTKPR